PLASRTASPFSAQQVLDGRVLECEIAVHLLQLRVLGLELLEPSEIGDLGAAVARLPVEVAVPADPVLADDLGDRYAVVAFLQHVHDVRLGEAGLAHRTLPWTAGESSSKCLPRGEAYGRSAGRCTLLPSAGWRSGEEW